MDRAWVRYFFTLAVAIALYAVIAATGNILQRHPHDLLAEHSAAYAYFVHLMPFALCGVLGVALTVEKGHPWWWGLWGVLMVPLIGLALLFHSAKREAIILQKKPTAWDTSVLLAGIGALGVLVFGASVYFASPQVRAQAQWLGLQAQPTRHGMLDYISHWPRTPNAARADDLIWAYWASANTVAGYSRYEQDVPGGRHAAEAERGIDDLNWQAAVEAKTFIALRGYLDRHPDGAYAGQAHTLQMRMLADEALYRAALESGGPQAIEHFLADFPGHAREVDAREALDDYNIGRDLFELISAGKFEATVSGGGIQSVSLDMTNKTDHAVRVIVPPGTFFVSNNSSAQNMVTTAAHVEIVPPGQHYPINISTACANLPRHIPQDDDHFTVRPSPIQADLARLAPVLADAKATYAVQQAAVWILSDNASYSDLGILQYSQYGFGGTRAIDEADALAAIAIIESAGIDISRRRIAQDRTWLEQQVRNGPDGTGVP